MDAKQWETYEEVASYLLNEMARVFGLQRVEGKQKVAGLRSGTEYVIDAKGVTEDNQAFVIIECRRYTHSKQKQEQIGGLAYRIMDTRAKGGIVVSTLGLQDGADKIAKAENIVSIQLNENSTRTNYILQFLNQLFLGVTDTASLLEEVSVIRRDTDT
jgi:hypothetical protein